MARAGQEGMGNRGGGGRGRWAGCMGQVCVDANESHISDKMS